MQFDAVARARQLVGCRYRPQGRKAEFGFDCVGLVCAAFQIPPDMVPADYRLRGASAERVQAYLDRLFRNVPEAEFGDVQLFEVGGGQLHLGIKTDRGLIHAHAGLRTVVETPGEMPWLKLSAHRGIKVKSKTWQHLY